MIRRPPRSTRTYTLFPYTTLFRSRHKGIGTRVEASTPGSAYNPSATTLEELAHFGAATERRIERIERVVADRSEEHTSELQSLMRISYAVFCLKKKKNYINNSRQHTTLHI